MIKSRINSNAQPTLITGMELEMFFLSTVAVKKSTSDIGLSDTHVAILKQHLFIFKCGRPEGHLCYPSDGRRGRGVGRRAVRRRAVKSA